jgi:hypothetical protein
VIATTARYRRPTQAAFTFVLRSLGWTLAQAHLLRELPLRGLTGYHGKGDQTVEFVR